MPSYAHIISILWTWTITKRIYFIFVIEIFFYFLHHGYINKWKVQQWMNENLSSLLIYASHSLALASKAENFQHIHPAFGKRRFFATLFIYAFLFSIIIIIILSLMKNSKKWEKYCVIFTRVWVENGKCSLLSHSLKVFHENL